jgi:hypothetical protein
MVVCGEAMTIILAMLKSNIELSGTQAWGSLASCLSRYRWTWLSIFSVTK